LDLDLVLDLVFGFGFGFGFMCSMPGGLFVVLSAMLDPGDEVIIFSPVFDIYEGAIRRAEGKVVQV
jgi:hypothetical protein